MYQLYLLPPTCTKNSFNFNSIRYCVFMEEIQKQHTSPKNIMYSPGWVAQLARVSSQSAKVVGSMPGSLVRAHTRTNQ